MRRMILFGERTRPRVRSSAPPPKTSLASTTADNLRFAERRFEYHASEVVSGEAPETAREARALPGMIVLARALDLGLLGCRA